MRPSADVTQQESFETILGAHRAFDRREPGWTKVAALVSEKCGTQVSGWASCEAAGQIR
jgi:hypothetical protein